MGGHHLDGRVPGQRREHLGGPSGRLPPLADRDHGTHQRSHHVVAERVRDHVGHRDSGFVPPPLQPPQRPHRGGPGALPAERREVMLPQQAARRGVHRVEIQRAEMPHGLVPLQRVGQRRIVAHPVGVPPPQRREPRVETWRRGLRTEHPHLRRQHPAQPVPEPAFSGLCW
jgi:hypothetical protein